jgi:hypothetical protein
MDYRNGKGQFAIHPESWKNSRQYKGRAGIVHCQFGRITFSKATIQRLKKQSQFARGTRKT